MRPCAWFKHRAGRLSRRRPGISPGKRDANVRERARSAGPVLSGGACAGGSRLRLLAITSTSSRETESLLWMARRKGISPVVLLTHPFEFIKHRDFRYREMREDRVNQARLRRLLDFLTVNRHAFATTTFAESGGHWLAAGSRPGELLRVPAVLALARRGQNAANTWVWRY